jgi:DNA-binding PadR family transcriptional regulator
VKLLEAKQRALGTVAFIGQLYMKDLLPDKICRVCLINLVSVSPNDLQIESAYELLQIIGKKYDATEKGKSHLDKIFEGLKNNSRMGEGLKKRTQVLISIAKDFRSKDWELNKKIETAKTIEEIHAEFEKEKGVGAARGGSRATATFDEYIFDATSKYSKQLKFALSGGCAIRRSKAAGSEADSNAFAGMDASILDKFTIESSAMTEEPEEMLNEPELLEDDEEDEIELMPAEEREEMKDNFIRTFMMKRKEGKKPEEVLLREFVLTVKRMGWPNRTQLVDAILNFTFDMAKDEASPIGEALNMLCKDGYIKDEDLHGGMDEWCEWYSTNEADSPMLNFYFANIFIHLIRDETLSLERINESFKKDAMIDKERRGKEYGHRSEFLAYLLLTEPDLSFSPDDWGITAEQIEALKAHYKEKQ